MKNFKIRTKLILCFSSILVLLVIMNGFSLSNLRNLSNLTIDFYDGPYTGAVAATSMMRDVQQIESAIKGMLLGEDMNACKEQYAKAIENIRKDGDAMVKTSSDHTGLSQLDQQIVAIDNLYKSIVQQMSEGDMAEAKQLSMKELQTAMDTLSSTVAVQAQNAHNRAVAACANADKRADFVILVQDILFAVIVIVSFGIALRLTRGITRPLANMSRGMQQVAVGQFDVNMIPYSRDEIGVLTVQLNETVANITTYIHDIDHVLGEMSRGNMSLEVDREYIGEFGRIKTSLNNIIDSFNNTIIQLRGCCDQVESGASNLANNAQLLAHGSVEQSAAVEEFQASLNRVAELTAQDGEHASEVQRLSIQTRDALANSVAQMNDMSSSMGRITEASREIAKVIKIIEDIAFQTNILALNAAVEAARAGAAGKGFAVVADEVRNLASKSAQAASNTNTLITNAVLAVDEGQLKADAAGAAISRVDSDVNSMTALLTLIDESTHEQDRAFKQIMMAMERITSVVQSNSSAAEENSAASEELSQQARVLEELVSQFKTKPVQETARREMLPPAR